MLLFAVGVVVVRCCLFLFVDCWCSVVVVVLIMFLPCVVVAAVIIVCV